MSKVHLDKHPCFNEDAHYKYGRIHLALAPKCNIACRYCSRDYDCPNESRPGVSSKVLNVKEAMEVLELEVKKNKAIKVVGIAGPGEPLFNDETFGVFRLVKEKYPGMIKCLSSNGLLVEECLQDLVTCQISSLTVTVNALEAKIAEKIYRPMRHNKMDLSYHNFLDKQWLGIEKAIENEIIVKINTVYIPGLNDLEIIEIAKKAKAHGVYKMNIMPLIPQGEMSEMKKPDQVELNKVRDQANRYIDQIYHCKQCRADAVGIPGLDG